MSERRSCKICRNAWPPPDHFIGDMGLTKAYLFEDQFFSGWTVLVLKDHRTELFQLTREDRGLLMEEVSRMGEALSRVFAVNKINSELLGNQVPHIHWHVIPRLMTDSDPLKPVWCIDHESINLSPGCLDKRLGLLRSALHLS